MKDADAGRTLNEYRVAHADEIEPLPPEFSEDRLALAFTERHGTELCYVAGWGRWLQWDESAWRFDETLRVFELARRICREASERCDIKRLASRIASAQTVASVVRLAQADRVHARTVGCWDADPWLLNTPGGTVDLRTGELRAHRRDDHITKRTSVSPAAACPTWARFLERVTDRIPDPSRHGLTGPLVSGLQLSRLGRLTS